MSRAGSPRVAVVGAGHWGKNLIRNFAALGALAAVVEPDAALARERASAAGVMAVDWRDVLADDSIDGVVLATPTDTHHPLARAAIEAGKHVFVEKPFTRDVAQAEDLVALAAARGRRLMVGHLIRYHAAYRTLCTMVAEGAIGRLRYISAHRLAFGVMRPGEGALHDLAPHDVSIVLGLAGDEPSVVRATGAALADPDHCDMVHLHLRFPSGVAAHVFASWLNPFKEHRLVAIGDEGALVFEDSNPDPGRKLTRFRGRIERQDGLYRAATGAMEPVAFAAGEPLRDECAEFLACIGDGRPPLTDGAEAIRVMRVIERAAASLNAQQ